MGKSRTKKAALNVTTAAIYEVVALICGLILPRLILRNFGSAYNGITSSAKQFLSAIEILNLGIAGTTRVALYKSLADGDHKKTCGLVRATEKYMRKVGLVLVIYIAILCVVYPMVVDTGYEWIDVALLIFAAGVSAFGQYYFGTAYSAFLSAAQSAYITNIFNIAGVILNLIVSVILIKCGCSIQIVKLGSSIVFFLRPMLRNIYVTKKFKLDKKCEPDNSALALRKDVMAHSIANIVHDNTDIIVLTLFCNVKIVSVYTVYNLVMSALKKIQSIFSSGTEALFGDMWAKGEIKKIKHSLTIYEFIISVSSSIVFSTALVMILPFVSLYTKGVTDVEYIIPLYSLVIIFAQMMYCFRTPYLTLVQGAGKYKETKNGAFVEAGMNLCVSIALVHFIGIVGVAIGTLAANIFRTVQYALFIEKNIVSRGKKVFVLNLMWSILNVAIVSIISSIILKDYAYTGWMQWVVSALITFALASIITMVSSLLCYRTKLKDMIKYAKRMINKKFKKNQE